MCEDVTAVVTETRTIGIEGGASNLLKENAVGELSYMIYSPAVSSLAPGRALELQTAG